MTHPLSPAAVEAARMSVLAKFGFDVGLAIVDTALSAAFEQSRAEGNAIDAFGSAPADGGYSVATWATELEPVLIIRKAKL